MLWFGFKGEIDLYNWCIITPQWHKNNLYSDNTLNNVKSLNYIIYGKVALCKIEAFKRQGLREFVTKMKADFHT